MGSVEIGPFAIASALILVKVQAHAGTIRKKPQRFKERKVLHGLNECEGCATFAAAETFEDLPFRVNAERAGFLLVKRAHAKKVLPASLERDIVRDNIDNVGAFKDLVDDCLGDFCHVLSPGMVRWRYCSIKGMGSGEGSGASCPRTMGNRRVYAISTPVKFFLYPKGKKYEPERKCFYG